MPEGATPEIRSEEAQEEPRLAILVLMAGTVSSPFAESDPPHNPRWFSRLTAEQATKPRATRSPGCSAPRMRPFGTPRIW